MRFGLPEGAANSCMYERADVVATLAFGR